MDNLEGLCVIYISGGLELLGNDKFKTVGGVDTLKLMGEIPENFEGNVREKACDLLNNGLSLAIADEELIRKKKIAIANIVNDVELPADEFPLECTEIKKKCLVLLISSAEPEINERAQEAWDDFFEIAARVAATNIPQDIIDEIERVKYLFNQFPEIPKAGLSYLRYCYRNNRLPPEEKWLNDLLDFSDALKGKFDLTTEILACIV